MPSDRQNKKVVENAVADTGVDADMAMNDDHDAFVADTQDNMVDTEEPEFGHDDEEDDDESSSSDGADEGDFGVEKDDDDEDDEQPGGHDDDDEDEDDEDIDGELSDAEGDEDEDDAAGDDKQKGGTTRLKGKRSSKVSTQQPEGEYSQYGIDSDDEDIEYEKFDEGNRDQYLLNFHPESRAVNFDEVKSLCTVVRDADGDIVDDFHTTIPILTKYEKARILGLRAKQLNSNIRPAIPVPTDIVDSYRIAELELEAQAIPFIIKRPMPDGRSEYWRIQDLTCVY